MTLLEGRLEIELGCQDWAFVEFLSSRDGPIDNPLDAFAEHAQEEFSCDHTAVDGHPGWPFVTFVVCEVILLDDSSMFVDGVLLLDVHWGEKIARDFPRLVKWQGEAVAEMDIL